MKGLNINKTIGIILFLFGSFLYYSNEKLNVIAYDLLGPKFFPRIVCGGILFLSILLFFTKVKEERKDKDKEKLHYKLIILFILISLFYLLSLEYRLGFLISTFLYLLISIFMLDNYKFKNLPKIVLFSLISTYIIYYFFQILLNLFLP